MKKITMLMLLIGLLGFAGVVVAQDVPEVAQEVPEEATNYDKPDPGSLSNRQGYVSLGIAGGAFLDPDMGAIQGSVDYFITKDIAVGPLFQFGIGPEENILGVSGQVKYSAPLMGNDKVRPYGQVGVGFAQIFDADGEDDTVTTYLLPVGGGFEFEIMPQLNLDFGITFNISDNIYMGGFAGVRYLF